VKVAPADSDRTLQRLDPAIQAVFLYGPNQTLLQQRAHNALKAWLPEGDDGFNQVTVTPDQLKQTPSLLGDELTTMSFFGGRKVIIFKDADDKHVPNLKALLDDGIEHRLIIQSGELGPRSALRLWGEAANGVATIACYDYDTRDITRILQQQAQDRQAKLERDASDMLAQMIGTQAELIPTMLDKLVAYAGTQPAVITGDMVRQACVDQVEATADDIIQHTMDGELRGIQRHIGSYYAAGESSVALLRMLQNYLYRLKTVQVSMTQGHTAEESLKYLKPPVFFKQKTAFMRHVQRWPESRLDWALKALMETETACKQTGSADELLVRQLLYQMTTG
jgi:DNA polymerase-3 subunit delta